MAQVTISVSNREYAVACEDGQEGRILQLASRLDDVAKSFGEAATQINESTLLIMIALVMADAQGTTALSADVDVEDRLKVVIRDINDVANKLKLL